jgi:hypothetical protein
VLQHRPRLNEIDESDLQDEKHPEQRISTDRGIVIDVSDDDENVLDSIRVNRESFGNEIDESDLQEIDEKHSEQRISTNRGLLMGLTWDRARARAPIHRRRTDHFESETARKTEQQCHAQRPSQRRPQGHYGYATFCESTHVADEHSPWDGIRCKIVRI